MNHATPIARPFLGALFALAALPVALVLGYVSGESVVLGVAAAAGLALLAFVVLLPIAIPVKLIFMVVSFTLLQRVFGYFRFADVRGINIGNLFLFASICYWFLQGLKRGQIYQPNALDRWILLALVLFPLFSIFFTVTFRRVYDYTLNEELSRFKQWLTPLVYFFLVCQCVDSKKDLRYLYYLIIGLMGFVVLHDLPELLSSRDWREGRSEGILEQPNEYAALLASVSPFLVLAIFLFKKRHLLRLFSLVLLSGIALAILTTYSRAGYFGFGMALAAGAYLAYKATGRFPINTPVIVLIGASLLPVIIVPEVLDSVTQRFQLESYKGAKRKSYSQYKLLNQYTGDRLVLWKGALLMAEKNPFLGVGFHAYHTEIAKYHPKGIYGVNYPHNVFLGALAEGGVIWLCLILVFYWKLFQILHENWGLVLEEGDAAGQVICGGALITFFIVLWVSCSNDFFNPGPKNSIILVLLAGAVRYGMLMRAETLESLPQSRAPAAG
jgi:O-antigen ligase